MMQLYLIDTKDRYVIKTLAPVSAARTIPTNNQIANAFGDFSIGTFADPPEPGRQVGSTTEDSITIVPDKGTFSLVVKASKKNQNWISKLIEPLDKRRPQVLTEATLSKMYLARIHFKITIVIEPLGKKPAL